MSQQNESEVIEFTSKFKTWGVKTKSCPFKLQPLPKPTLQLFKSVQEKDFNSAWTFPPDYVRFCIEIGGGKLGRARIFTLTENLGPSDVRFHSSRLLNKFKTFKKKIHSFPLNELIIFANDLEHDLWFGWKQSSKSYEIYCVDENEEAPPPLKVCDNFVEFLEKVCIGKRMSELQVAYYFKPKKDDGKDEIDDDEKSDEEEELPPKTFTPFPKK